MAVTMPQSNQADPTSGGRGGLPLPPPPSGGAGVDLGALMNLLLLVSPVLEISRPGAGLGTAGAVLQHRSQLERRRREEGLSLADYLAGVEDKDLDITAAALTSLGYDASVVREAKRLSRAMRPKKSPLELETERLMEALAPEMAQSRATGVPLQQILTPERVRALQAQGVNIPFDIETTDISTGTETVTEEQPFTIRPPLAALTSGSGPQAATQGVAPVRLTRPIVERREQVTVKGAKQNAVPTFGDLFSGAMDTPFARATIPVDKDGRPDLNEATQIAARMGWIRTEADTQAQRARHQQFLRDKLTAHFARTQQVHLPTLRAQMEDLGMVWGAEVVAARKRTEEDKVEVTLPNGQVVRINAEKAVDLATRQPTSMVTVRDPVTGQMVTIPATSLPSFFPRRAPGDEGGTDRVRERQVESRRLEAEADLEAAQEEKTFLLANVPPRTTSDPVDPEVQKPNPEFAEWHKRLAEADSRIRKARAVIKGLDRVQGRQQLTGQPQGQQGFESLPNPAQYKGRTIRDTKTGKRYRSDGKRWVEVK